MSINRRLIIFTSSAIILSMMLVYFVSSAVLNRVQLNSAYSYLETAAYSARNLLEQRLDEMESAALLLIAFNDIAGMAAAGDAAALQARLLELKQMYPYLSVGLILGASGAQLAALPEQDMAAAALFQPYLAEAAPLTAQALLPLDSLFTAESGLAAQYAVTRAGGGETIRTGLMNLTVCPVRAGERIAAYVVLGEIINHSAYYPAMYSELLSDSYLSISAGNIRVCTNIASAGASDYIGTVIPEFSAAKAMGNGRYFGSEYAPIGDNYFFLYEPLQDYAGALLGYLSVGIPEHSYMRMLDLNRRTITLVLLGSLPLIILGSYFFGRHITRPIVAGTRIAKRISEGDFSAVHDYPRQQHPHSEADILLEAITEMADTLERNKRSIDRYLSELNERHAEATQLSRQLMQLNEQLESMVDARTLELRQTVAALHESNRVKNSFLANMSHELKTPLSSNISASELLLEEIFGPLNDKQTKYIKNIWLSSNHLLQLINDILDISKIEAGKTQLALSVCPVRSVFGEAISVVKSIAYQKAIRFTIDIEPEQLLVTADRRLFKQILYNLLSNAIKFSPPESEIILRAAEAPLPADGSRAVRCIVEDHGVGIAAADLERVFREFEQGDNSYSREYGGTGLGLPLSQRQVELHGGSIELHSRLNEGTRVVFYLPLLDELLREYRENEAAGGGREEGARDEPDLDC